MIKRTKFNISILGDYSVGKTSLVNSLKGVNFNENQLATIGVDDVVDEAMIDNKKYIFKIFDTAGQEKYKNVSTKTVQLADGFFLVFSIVSKQSFECINQWIKTIEERTNIYEKVVYLIGNKIDLDGEKREISNEEAVKFSKLHNMKYYETSAKTGYNIKEAFQKIYIDIYNLNKKLYQDNSFELRNIVDKKKSCC